MNMKNKKNQEFAKGLEGVISNITRIGYVDGPAGKLSYRGYDIRDLAEQSCFEEVVYLLLYGKLPTGPELNDFQRALADQRKISDEVLRRLDRLPCPCHPMSMLRSGISLLECIDETCRIATTLESKKEAGLKLIAQTATLTAAIARMEKNLAPIPPDADLSHAENFLYMLQGRRPDPVAAKTMDLALILHADHGMNASTFATMVVASTLSDLHSAIAAGVATLKGPLHGGANERVIRMLLDLSSVEEAEAYIEKAVAGKEKIMGFGHRVYKTYDPRAVILRSHAEEIARETGQEKLFLIAQAVERKGIEAYADKGIFPNVDFYSGLVYHCLGIETNLFTPIFAVSRIAGWVARTLEYLEENRLFRPRAVYVGPRDRTYLPIEER